MYKISKISIITFAHQHIQACYEPRTFRCLVFALLMNAAFHVFHHHIGQYSFYLSFNMKKQVAFPDKLSELTFLHVTER